MSAAEEYQFQAETKQLLELVIHSLYTNKEIFLRELISNSSDALDRLRFEALTHPELIGPDHKSEIRLEVDEQARTLAVSDTGIGMSRDEVIENIGTIARSGTRELRERMAAGQPSELLAEFIGQFGVGFYSSFMVADKVTLVTRKAGEAVATMWESTADGTYHISPTERHEPGTTVTLHLKPVDSDNGIENYCDPWVLSRIVKKHSDFVAYPIKCQFEREEMGKDESGKPSPGAEPVHVIEDKTLNSMRPIWIRPRSEVSDEEYAEFYHHISHDWTEPLKTIALRAEGNVEYQALLFIPSKAPESLFYHTAQGGLRLYAKRVMIVEECEDLLPRYLRFIKGLVDSADLPLNVSRQMLQQDRHLAQIRKWLTRKVLDALQEVKDKTYEKYLEFWNEFGRAIKEGIPSDHDNREQLLQLSLFQSSDDSEKLTTLDDYVSRMKDTQEEIYYLTGESRTVIENSPHLEAFKEHSYEVLYLTDPIDEVLVQLLMDHKGKRLKSAAKGTLKLGDTQQKEQTEKDLKEKEEQASDLLKFIQQTLDAHIKQVRLSNRLVSSPACVVGTEADFSPQLERLLQKGKGGGPKQRRILELNPTHKIFVKLQERFNKDPQDKTLPHHAELLLGYALLAEGSELPDPVKFNSAVAELMVRDL